MSNTPSPLECLTPAVIDQAVRMHTTFKFDRDRFSHEILSRSPEFMEYVAMFEAELHHGRYSNDRAGRGAAIASALTIGIEIGVALALLDRRTSA